MTGYKPPKLSMLRAKASIGGVRARLKTKAPRVTSLDDDEPGRSSRPVPSLPKLKFMERPELPPFDEWRRS
jgi:hypothetical protein